MSNMAKPSHAQSELGFSPELSVAVVMHPFQAPPDSVSTHIWVHEVARRLAENCSIIVYTARGHVPSTVETRDHVVYRRIRIPSQTRWAELFFRLPLVGRLKGAIPQHSSWYYWGHALQIAWDIRLKHCQIVHVLNLPHFASIIRTFNPKAKIILHMHAGLSGPRRWLERHLQRIDRIISCSNFFSDQVRGQFPQFSDRCTTIYNGVDIERFAPRPKQNGERDGQRLLYVGTVSPHKGLHVLIDALAIVRRRYPRIRLDIVGPPWQLPAEFLSIVSEPQEVMHLLRFYDGKGYVSHLEEQIALLELADSVRFVGLLPNTALGPYYRDADVFVFPSVCNEAFGMPAAEAMASGIPVVASRAAGLSEVVVDSETGLLVERGNAAALANAIVRLLGDDNLRRSMGQAGRKRVLQNFTWDNIAQHTLEEYNRLMSVGQPRNANRSGVLQRDTSESYDEATVKGKG
jgi:glycosyltransferase involved in cell wall biosynthesis